MPSWGSSPHPNSQGVGEPQSSLWVYTLGQYDSCVMIHPPGTAYTKTDKGVSAHRGLDLEEALEKYEGPAVHRSVT